jgi:hypothetical protein
LRERFIYACATQVATGVGDHRESFLK